MHQFIRRVGLSRPAKRILKFLKNAVYRVVFPPGAMLSGRSEAIADFITYTAQSDRVPQALFDSNQMRICWIIPDFVPGAGGHMTIFRIASHLESFGHDITFIIQNPSVHGSGKDAATTINSHFQPFRGRVYLFTRDLPVIEGDALIATDFLSCYPARSLSGFRRKFYLVQDHETQFHPMGARAFLAENSYTMGFDCLCAGDWLADLIREKFEGWAMSWPLAYDPNVYFSRREEARSERRIAFYCRFLTERRAVELGMLALDLLHARGERFHVDFFGYPLKGLKVKYSFTDHGILPPSELGRLYRSVDVGMVFSATNHSLVNREMMACGLPVVDLDIESVRRVFPDDAVWRVKPWPEAIADGIQHLLSSRDCREKLTAAGLAHIEGLSWDKSARLIESTIAERIAEKA
jgi:glycosyltransferase involved in cell wall biosynthesis